MSDSKWTTAENERLMHLHATGLSIEAVANELGRPLNSVRQKYRILLPQRVMDFRRVATDSEMDVVTPSQSTRYRLWTDHEEEYLTACATTVDMERIARDLGRIVFAVRKRWEAILLPRLKQQNHSSDLSDGSAGRKNKQLQCTTSKVSQPDPQSRRNFTTLHGRKPHSGTSFRRQSLALTCSPHWTVGGAQRSLFSLPYRPQQRYEHTESTSSQAKTRRKSRRLSAEDDSSIVDMRATGHTWDAICEKLGLNLSTVWRRSKVLMQEERWVRRFEVVKSTTPDDQRYRSSKSYFTAKDDAIIEKMARETESSFATIAKTLNRSPNAIANRWRHYLDDSSAVVRRSKIRAAQRPFGALYHRFTAEEDRQLTYLASSGTKLSDITVALNITDMSSIHRRLKTLRARSGEKVTRKPKPKP
jgi:hypothetical protein